LLCSDGLYKAVSPGEIVDCLEQAASASQKARNLVMKANGNGGPDNITVILAEIQVEAPLPRADGAPGNS